MLRVRRARPSAARIRRAPRTAFSAGREVSITLTVAAVITEGSPTEEDFAEWVRDALDRYHLWRNGWVGIGMVGKVKTPKVEVVCPEE